MRGDKLRGSKSPLFKHGFHKDRLYKVWKGMRQRCRDKKSKSYYRYGALGIDVCSDWDNYVSFMNWSISSGYKEGLTIDRIDNSKGYSPDNCRWVDKYTQAGNVSTNHKVVINGNKLNAVDVSRMYNINYSTLLYRIRSGWSIDEIIKTKAVRGRNQHNRQQGL